MSQRRTYNLDMVVTPATDVEAGYREEVIIAGAAGGAAATVAAPSTPAAATDSALVVTIRDQQAEYETVAASQVEQVMGTPGAIGDYLAGIVVIPDTLVPGNVILLDGATSIVLFVGGAGSVSNLVPFLIPLGIKSVSGEWKITTGANVHCVAIGDFT